MPLFPKIHQHVEHERDAQATQHQKDCHGHWTPIPAPAERHAWLASVGSWTSPKPNCICGKGLRFDATSNGCGQIALCASSHCKDLQFTPSLAAMHWNHAFSRVRKSWTAHKDSVRR
jgi:hypothetical protein